MIKASDVKKLGVKADVYVESRIKDAGERGFSSTKAWVNSADLHGLINQLREAGYTVETVTEDPATNRSQIAVMW